MRLLLVSAAHHPTHGGIGAAVWLFIERAARAGWHIELVTRPSKVFPACARVHVVHTSDMQPQFSRWIGPLRAIHRIRPYRYGLWSLGVARTLLDIENAFDAVGVVDSQAEGYVALTSRRVREQFRDTPMYVHAHTPMWLIEEFAGMDRGHFGRAIYHEWERAAIGAADGVITPSQLLHGMMSIASASAVVPHCLPECAARNNAPDQVLLFVGNIEHNKGVDVWARSLNVVLSRIRSATAIMIGRDTATGPRGTSMVEHVRSLLLPHIRSRVRWLSPIAHENVCIWMQRAAAVVIPSRFESFSYVAAEAMTLGTPVISSDKIGIGEYVPDLMSVPVNDDAALAEAQCDILSNAPAARSRALHCRQQLMSACGDARILDALHQFLATLTVTGNRPDSGAIDSLDEIRDVLASIEDQIGIPATAGSRVHAAAERS